MSTPNSLTGSAAVIALLISGAVSLAVRAAPVHLEIDTGRSQEHGAGISVGNGVDCFVVAPLHVVEFARSITVTDRHGRSAKADPYQAPGGVDAALLKVEQGHALDCPADWDDGLAGEQAMQESDFLVSRKVKQGEIQQRRFFLGSESATEMSLEPFSATQSNRLIEGDSGSSVYAKNLLVGMIVNVDTASGTGQALKQSQIHALFGNLVLNQSAKLALITPVYFRNAENPYATNDVKNFLQSRTSFDVMEMNQAEAMANLQNRLRGIEPDYPDNVDYVISSSIIENRSRNENNPNYDAKAAKTKNIGKQLLNNFGNKSARYIQVSNIDVEVEILLPKEKRQISHIERLEYKVALTPDVDQNELRTSLPARAAVDALHAAMLKYNLPIEAEETAPEKPSIWGTLFNSSQNN